MSDSNTSFTRGENPLRADKLNTAFSERVARRGDTMQGQLTLWRDPVVYNEAATKQYVDTRVGSTAISGSLNNVGRNLINNPLFNVAQRGVGPFISSSAYTLDRWIMFFGGGSMSISTGPMSDVSRSQIGDEAATVYLANTFTGTAGANDLNLLQHRIESIRRLSGKTVTVSFYASASASLKLGVSINQTFGTGGSPSADTSGTGQSVTLSGVYIRYSLTFAIPSSAGKTFGTANNDSTQLNFWFSTGANTATASGNVGVQSGTISLWGVQLEVGSVATPLDYGGPPQQQLAQCQRFYQVGVMQVYTYSPVASGIWGANIFPFPVTMRAQPTITPSWSSQVNCTGSMSAQSAGYYQVYLNATATGGVNATGSFTASADL